MGGPSAESPPSREKRGKGGATSFWEPMMRMGRRSPYPSSGSQPFNKEPRNISAWLGCLKCELVLVTKSEREGVAAEQDNSSGIYQFLTKVTSCFG